MWVRGIKGSCHFLPRLADRKLERKHLEYKRKLRKNVSSGFNVKAEKEGGRNYLIE